MGWPKNTFVYKSNLRRRKIFIVEKFLPCKQQTHTITKDIVDQLPSMRGLKSIYAELCGNKIANTSFRRGGKRFLLSSGRIWR